MLSADAEDLIASLAGDLAPADREAFRREAEATLLLSPQSCLGPDSIYRTLVPVWRSSSTRRATNASRVGAATGSRFGNNLIDAPASEDGRAYRHLRIAK